MPSLTQHLDVATRVSGSEVVLEKNCVIKRQSPERGHIEYVRTMIGRKIADKTLQFIVPDVLSFNETSGEIVFELLNGMESLTSTLRQHSRPEELICRAGRALSAIHLLGKSYSGRTLPQSSEEVFLHGDYGLANVHYLPDDDKLVVLDWNTAHWLGIPSKQVFGSPSMDLVVFLISLYHRRAFSSKGIPHTRELAENFLNAYFEESSNSLMPEKFEMELNEKIDLYSEYFRRQYSLARSLAYYLSLLQLQQFITKYVKRK